MIEQQRIKIRTFRSQLCGGMSFQWLSGGVEPSLGQCGLRTLGVTERPGVHECGRAQVSGREASYKDRAKEGDFQLEVP